MENWDIIDDKAQKICEYVNNLEEIIDLIKSKIVLHVYENENTKKYYIIFNSDRGITHSRISKEQFDKLKKHFKGDWENDK